MAWLVEHPSFCFVNGTQNKQWRHCREWHVIFDKHAILYVEGKGVRIAPSNVIYEWPLNTLIGLREGSSEFNETRVPLKVKNYDIKFAAKQSGSVYFEVKTLPPLPFSAKLMPHGCKWPQGRKKTLSNFDDTERSQKAERMPIEEIKFWPFGGFLLASAAIKLIR